MLEDISQYHGLVCFEANGTFYCCEETETDQWFVGKRTDIDEELNFYTSIFCKSSKPDNLYKKIIDRDRAIFNRDCAVACELHEKRWMLDESIGLAKFLVEQQLLPNRDENQ